MDKEKKNIILIEPSLFIYEGISISLKKIRNNYIFFHLKEMDDLEILCRQKNISIVLLPPSLITNKETEFQKIKLQYPDIFWVGILYSFYDNDLLNNFDTTFSIKETPDKVIDQIEKLLPANTPTPFQQGDELTEREKEVLKHLIKGLTNKEVAHTLNISTHTVNTHRKNIIHKTGIKSLPGLTVYAVSKEIITLDNLLP